MQVGLFLLDETSNRFLTGKSGKHFIGTANYLIFDGIGKYLVAPSWCFMLL